jgi:hypothetical protein
MKTVLKGLLLAGVVLALTGCGVSGRWTMESVKPEGMEKEFALKCMCLMDDGTFQACAKEGAEMKMMKGTYKYDANAKTLTFTSPDGKARTYNAEVVALGGEMKVWGAEKGKEWTAMMKKAGACSKDGCKSGTCCGMTCDPAKCKTEKAEPKKEEPKKADAKKVEPKKDEPKKPAAKPDDTKNKDTK